MKAQVDKWYPVVLGVIFAIAFLITNKYLEFSVSNDTKQLFTAAITISAISVGFLATAKSILISIRGTKIIKWMKDGGVYDQVVNYLMSAVNSCLGVAIVSALALLFDYSTVKVWHEYAFTTWIFLCVAAGLASYRVILLFSDILRNNE